MEETSASALSVLRRNRGYRLLATSFAISGIGDWMFGLALAVWVLQCTHSAGWVAAAVVARMAPYALLGSIGGVIADRYDRRKVLIVFDIVRAVLLVALTVVMLRGGPVVVAIALASATAVATVPYRPAVVAITPTLVARDDLAVANSIEAAINHTMLFAGPALGALLLDALTPSLVIAFDAATFLVSALLMARLPSSPRSHARTERAAPWHEELHAGVQATRAIVGARALLALLGLAGLAYGATLVTHVLFVEHQLGLPPNAAGYLSAASAIGGVLAISRAGRLAGKDRPAGVLLGSTALLGAPLVALALVHNPVLACLVMVPEGIGSVTLDIASVTVWQRITPSELLGRIYGLQDSIVGAGTLAGAFVAPLLVATLGVVATIATVGVIALVAVCVLAPSLRTIGDTPSIPEAVVDERTPVAA
jgi:MFS family permease